MLKNITWTHIFYGAIWYITLALFILAIHKGYSEPTHKVHILCPLNHPKKYYRFDYIPKSNGQWFTQPRKL